MKRIILVALLLIPAGLTLAQQFNGRDPSNRPRRNGTSGRTGGFNRGANPARADGEIPPVQDPRNLRPVLPETYLVLTTRSIFSRDGRAGRFGAPVGPQSQWAFRGAALQDGQYIAFLEDTTTHTVSSVSNGQSIAGGQVAQISLDTLSYIRDDRRTAVRIGQNLAGVAAPAFDAMPRDFAGAATGRGGPMGMTGRGGRGAIGGRNPGGVNGGFNGGRGGRGRGTTAAASPDSTGTRSPAAEQANRSANPPEGEQVAEANDESPDGGGPGFDGPLGGPGFDGGPPDGGGPGFDPGFGPGGPPPVPPDALPDGPPPQGGPRGPQ